MQTGRNNRNPISPLAPTSVKFFTLPVCDLDNFRGAENRTTDYVQGKVKDFDHSAWGYASPLQLEALQKQEMAAKYACTRTTTTRRHSNNDDYAWSAIDETHERPPSIFDKQGPLGMSDLESIKAEFVKTSQPLALASFATLDYMDHGVDEVTINHRFIANNEDPDLATHLINMANSSVISPRKPILQSLQDWETAAKRFDDQRLAGNRCLTLQPNAFAKMLADCEELVYSQGTYCGVFDSVALPDLQSYFVHALNECE